jgi:hypothetical protein
LGDQPEGDPVCGFVILWAIAELPIDFDHWTPTRNVKVRIDNRLDRQGNTGTLTETPVTDFSTP